MNPSDVMALKAYQKEKFDAIVKDRVHIYKTYIGEPDKIEKLIQIQDNELKKLGKCTFYLNRLLDDHLNRIHSINTMPTPNPEGI